MQRGFQSSGQPGLTKTVDQNTGVVEKKKSVFELFQAYSDSESGQVSEVEAEEEACNTLSNLSNEEEEQVTEVEKKSSPIKKRLRSSAGPDEFASIAPEKKRKKTDKHAKLKE